MTKRGAEKAEANGGGSETSERVAADIAFVEALARVLRENDLAELEVTREYGDDNELQVRLSRYGYAAPAAAPALAAPMPQLAAPAAHAPAQAAAPAAAAQAPSEASMVTSPMVGTVYLAPEPGASAFIAVGDRVTEGQTLVIIEAMKTMNQIPSTRAGVVTKILVENAQPVEYGAPLVVVE